MRLFIDQRNSTTYGGADAAGATDLHQAGELRVPAGACRLKSPLPQVRTDLSADMAQLARLVVEKVAQRLPEG